MIFPTTYRLTDPVPIKVFFAHLGKRPEPRTSGKRIRRTSRWPPLHSPWWRRTRSPIFLWQIRSSRGFLHCSWRKCREPLEGPEIDMPILSSVSHAISLVLTSCPVPTESPIMKICSKVKLSISSNVIVKLIYANQSIRIIFSAHSVLEMCVISRSCYAVSWTR